jgi:hypothetical protein
MKAEKKILRIAILLLAVVFVAGCAPGKYVPKANEELYGTWTNEKGVEVEKKISNSPADFKMYLTVSDTDPSVGGTAEILSKSKDSDGNIWYKTFGTFTSGSGSGTKYQCLWKISGSGTVMECVLQTVVDFDPKNYPSSIDKSADYYRIFFRAPK